MTKKEDKTQYEKMVRHMGNEPWKWLGLNKLVWEDLSVEDRHRLWRNAG